MQMLKSVNRVSFWDYFNEYPRSFGNPQRVRNPVQNREELTKLINSNIRFTDVYISFYKINNSEVTVDRIWLDIDEKDNTKLKSFTEEVLIPNDYQFAIVFSGGGWHLYLKINPVTLKIEQATSALIKFTNWLDDTYHINIDKQAMKDLVKSRLVRIIGSYNFKEKHFCIPLTLEEFLQNNIPNEQRFEYYFYGEKGFDIISFVEKSKEVTVQNGEAHDFKVDMKIPPLVEKLLEEKSRKWSKETGYWDRFVIITTLKALGYTEKEVEGIFRKYLTEGELSHALRMEKQPHYIYNRDGKSNEIFLPTVEWLMQMGYRLTEEDIKFYKNFYLSWLDLWWD